MNKAQRKRKLHAEWGTARSLLGVVVAVVNVLGSRLHRWVAFNFFCTSDSASLAFEQLTEIDSLCLVLPSGQVPTVTRSLPLRPVLSVCLSASLCYPVFLSGRSNEFCKWDFQFYDRLHYSFFNMACLVHSCFERASCICNSISFLFIKLRIRQVVHVAWIIRIDWARVAYSTSLSLRSRP